MAICMAVWSACKSCHCINCPQFRPYASVHYGWKSSQKKTLTVGWILMLTQKQQPVISAGIKRGVGGGVVESLRGAIYSNLCASPTWKWASKELRITGKRAVKAHMGPSSRHNFNASKIIDHRLPKIWTIHKSLRGLNLGFWINSCPFLLFTSRRTVRVNRSTVLNTPAGFRRSGLLEAFKWLFAQPGTGWHSTALQAGRDIRTPCQASLSAAPPHQRSLDCLFTICWGNPRLFIVMNNWAVCSGHSTKVCSVHSEARGGGSRSSVSRGGGGDTRIPAWSRSWCSLFLCSCRSLSGLHLLLILFHLFYSLHTATLLSPQSEERPSSASWDTTQIAGV